MKSFKMLAVLGWMGLSACGAPPEPEPEPELPAEPFDSEHGQDEVFAPAVAFGPNGHFTMTWAGPNDINVRRWTGSRWDTLGGGLSAFSGETPAFWSDVQVDGQGNPVVAWGERVPGDPTRGSILVRRWANGSWSALGQLNLGTQPGDTSQPFLRLDAEGNPLVAWSESTTEHQLAVRRWSAGKWQAVGSTTIAPGRAMALELVGGNPVLVSQLYDGATSRMTVEVRRWTGSAWERLGSALGERAIAPRLRADAAGNLFLAFLEEGTWPAPSRIQVVRWSGTAWDALGADVVVADESAIPGVPSLDLDAQGRPLVAWVHSGATQGLRLARWTGEEWSVKVVEESTLPGSSGGWCALAFHPTEGAVVAWTPHETAKLRVMHVALP